MKWLLVVVAAGCGQVEAVTDASVPGDTTVAAPSFTVTIDPVTTELLASAPVAVTVTSHDGFAGSVALTGAITTPSGDPVPAWTLVLDGSVQVDGTATATGVITTASVAPASLANTLTVTATSGADIVTATTTVTAANQVTFPVHVDNNACVYPANGGNLGDPVHIRVGTKVRFLNTGTVTFVIHSDGGADGIEHQGQGSAIGDPNTPAGAAYEQTLTGTALPKFDWYCHDLNSLGASNPEIGADP